MGDKDTTSSGYWTKRIKNYESFNIPSKKRTSDVDWDKMDTIMAKYGKQRAKGKIPARAREKHIEPEPIETTTDPNIVFKKKKIYSKIGKKISDSDKTGGLFHEGVWYPNTETRDDAIDAQEALDIDDIMDDDMNLS